MVSEYLKNDITTTEDLCALCKEIKTIEGGHKKCLQTKKVFLLLSDQYRNPERGFEPGSSSECLLEFDKHSKPLSHHGRYIL